MEKRNLNAGTGDPCAGHERLKLAKEDLCTSDLVTSVENLGEEPPTGSMKTSVRTGFRYNLKAGTGDPCAGQDMLKAASEDLLTPEVVRSVENFGAEPPTGSARENLDRLTNL